ncbi:Nucleoporin [Lachnellula hyalina]|uniref:Nucleoporin n=1 Tax=Lachnellula hyalina TaxID=1316788 RepID=A0A8H8U572_9HELO|nr:Nucleoporin [Lachnellula hyalina]TVY30929.1 Nucleoporin [Lachnellula hyalina]
MASFPQPRITKSQQSIQLSYDLPHRIHTTKTYPIKSPNGSTIILYGHENGVRIFWRGGRAFKPSSASSVGPKKTNGAKGAVISLESDDDELPAKIVEDKPEFEEGEEELDPSRPYPSILQTLDLHFGTNVLHLAILPTPALEAEGASWRGLDPVKKNIVFTAACGDNSLRLVTIPLTPPSPESKARPEFRADFTAAYAGKGKWGEKVTMLNGHQKPSGGVAITADFGRSKQASGQTGSHIIVASHSREVTGLLLLFKISVKSPESRVEPFQKIFLASPAKSISFNTSLSGHRFSQILIAETTGVCRVYDYNKGPNITEEGSESSESEQGSFLLSLYAGFQNTKDQSQTGIHAGFGRKNIVDAQWVSAGTAVIVLLSDGEWALWDIEGEGPGTTRNELPTETIHGGSRTQYSLTGYIDTGNKSRQSIQTQPTTSRFAPMTPSTRKATEPFSARGSSDAIKGKISVVEIAAPSPTTPSEESIVFWLGETYTIIPSLSKYWAANSRKTGSGNLFNSVASGSRMLRLEGIDLQGERCTGIDQITKTQGLIPEILVSGEHRLVILTTGSKSKELKTRQPERFALTEKSANNGELDVPGIDQELARMENGGSRRGKLFQS